MPLQNRVNPYGTIFRSPARGTFMGNRGALHNEKREIVRQFKDRRWITCCLEFRGRRRSVMSWGRYTELFFLDEAVVLRPDTDHAPSAGGHDSRHFSMPGCAGTTSIPRRRRVPLKSMRNCTGAEWIAMERKLPTRRI